MIQKQMRSKQPNLHKALPSIKRLREKIAADKIASAYKTPINFYGRVMDQHGNPVDGAAIKYSAIDRFFESGSKYGS